MKIGDNKRGIELLEQAHTKSQTVVGANNYETLFFAVELGREYRESGQLGKAESMLKSSLDLVRANYGADLPVFRKNLAELGLLYWNQRRYTESVPIYEEALQISQDHFGNGNDITIRTAIDLGLNYRDAGQFAKAQATIDQWLPIARASLDTHSSKFQLVVEDAISIYNSLNQCGASAAWLSEYFGISMVRSSVPTMA